MSKFTVIFVLLLAAGAGVCSAGDNDPVVFADPALKTAVEAALGLNDPTELEMKGLAALIAYGKGIVDLDGIEYATNLKRLELSHNNIADISKLSTLTTLEYLRLDHYATGNISNIDALAGLTSLQLLNLTGNAELSDISSLSGLINLYELHLSRTNISDISPLANMTLLTTLWLTENDLDCDAYNIYIPDIIEKNPGLDNPNTTGPHDYLHYDPMPEECLSVEIDALVDIAPDPLSKREPYATVFITLPEGHDAADIDTATILITSINGEDIADIPIDNSFTPVVGDHDGDGVSDLTVKFDLQDIVVPNPVGAKTIVIEGDTSSGTHFIGSDTIAVITGYDPTALIGIQPTMPTITYNGGGTTYDAETNVFTIDTIPVAIRFSAITPPCFIQPADGIQQMSLSLQVDEAGAFVGATPGREHGFIIEGAIDEDGDGVVDYSGVLLTGEVVEFGSLDTGAPTDLYDFRLMVTGGELTGFYNIKDIGITVQSENSNFSDDYHVDFSGGAKGVVGPIDAVCALEAAIEACVQVPEAPPTSESDCQGRIKKMTVVYTGLGCDASSHSQDDRKSSCIGDAANSEPVSIIVSDKKGKKIWASVDGVSVGDEIVIDSANVAEKKKKGKKKGKKHLDPHTKISVFNVNDELIHEVVFHTSCSKPLNVGDQFGAFSIYSMETTKGGTVVDEPPVEEEPVCITELPYMEGPHCDGKVTLLNLRYTGAGCEGSDNTQDPSKVTCTGGAASASPVRIVVTDKDENYQYLDTGAANVGLGDIVDVLASDGGRTEFKAETLVKIYNAAGDLIETVLFHTSCSQPLNLGDKFASIEIYGMANNQGAIASQELPVVYTYTVTNNSAGYPLSDVSVIDDVYGEVPGSPIASLAAGESVTLTLTAPASAAVTNTVSIVGYVNGILQCQATASASITEAVAPPPPEDCQSKIKSLLLKYIGPDIADATVEIVADKLKDTPVVYTGVNLVSGTVLSSPTENGFTIDGSAYDKKELGAKVSISINGVTETIHTSCSVPVIRQAPAPLDDPKGDPSTNWFVVEFAEKD